MATLQIREGYDTGRVLSLGDEIILGRSPEGVDPRVFLPLPDSKVSRRHARISREGDGYVIEDLGSTNGTWVSGVQIVPGQPHQLSDNDEVRISATLLVYRDQDVSTLSPSRYTQRTTRDSLADLAPEATGQRVLVKETGAPHLSVILDASRSVLGQVSWEMPPEESLTGALRRLKAMAQVSIALGSVANRRQLMGKIMDYIFDIFPDAERALVLLRGGEDEGLVPVAQRQREGLGAEDAELAISRTVVEQVLEMRQAILSQDAQGDARFGAQQSIIDLSIRSMMCAPLMVGDDVLGLIEVDSASDTEAFDQADLEILTGISAQAAIAVRNAQLYSDIEELFESFIRASVQAIEARDPVTAGHSFRVAEFTERLARAVDRSGDHGLRAVSFTPEQMRELRYAALLHDFGKVGVREHVLTKPKKLYPHQLELIRQRFTYARASLERAAYRKLILLHEKGELSNKDLVELRQATEEALVTERQRLDHFLELILQANEPSVSPRDVPKELSALLSYTFPGEQGDEVVILEDFEFSDLTAARGSLSPDERLQIESHVSHTYAFLSLIPWSGGLAQVPDIAYAHHEKLDGSGYPLGLSAAEIPLQSRIMTVADIYDALTAGDRPYKRGLPAGEALDILHQEVAAGKLDQALVRVFIEAEAWRPVV